MQAFLLIQCTHTQCTQTLHIVSNVNSRAFLQSSSLIALVSGVRNARSSPFSAPLAPTWQSFSRALTSLFILERFCPASFNQRIVFIARNSAGYLCSARLCLLPDFCLFVTPPLCVSFMSLFLLESLPLSAFVSASASSLPYDRCALLL